MQGKVITIYDPVTTVYALKLYNKRENGKCLHVDAVKLHNEDFDRVNLPPSLSDDL